MNELAALSPQQLRTLRCIVRGLSDKEIMRETGLAEGTVKTYTGEVYRRLAVRSRAQAIVKVAELAGVDLAGAVDMLRAETA